MEGPMDEILLLFTYYVFLIIDLCWDLIGGFVVVFLFKTMFLLKLL